MINGAVTIAVPSGWTAPSTNSANAGYTTATTGTVAVAGQTVTVSGVTLAAGGTFTIVYGDKTSGGRRNGAVRPRRADMAGPAGDDQHGHPHQPRGLTEITVNPSLTITSVVRNGGGRKYNFTGVGASGSSAVTVTICTVNSFPCAAPVTTSATGANPPYGWTSGASAGNLGSDLQYYAQATQGSQTSAVFPFVSTNTTPAVVPGGVVLANGGANPGKAEANDTATITFGEPFDASTFCSTWTNAGVQSSGASIRISNNGNNDTLNTLTVGGCTFNFASIALGGNYVSSTVTFSSSTVSWDPSTCKLTITLGGGTAQNAGIAAAVPQYTASTSISDLNGVAIAAGPWGGTSSRF